MKFLRFKMEKELFIKFKSKCAESDSDMTKIAIKLVKLFVDGVIKL